MKLLEPLNIRSLVLKNRIIMPAMCTNFASTDGYVTDRLIAYYAARARGGVGLIVTGNAYIEIGGKSMTRQLGLDDEDKIPKLKELTHAVHFEGGKICAQLNHGGRNSLASITGRRPVAPSPNLSFRYLDGDLPEELEHEGIKCLIEAYRKASLFAKAAGFDAIEIHAAHGYLIAQFLSAYTNKRSDDYGGPLENRVRFLREVLVEVRSALGENFPIFVRISGEEFVPGGGTIKEAKYVAKVIEENGGDVIDVSMGQGPSSPEDRDYQITRHQNVPPMDFPEGCWVKSASQIKEVVNIPVMTVGRINEPYFAERILQEGWADLIGMGRALIADPDLPKKVAEGKIKEIRRCIACNQGCAERIFKLRDIECLINAQVGHESEREIKPSEKSKKLLVVGGGPGGMEAARVGALRGHEVVLVERSSKLGGQLRLAAAAPYRTSFKQYVQYQEERLKALNVQLIFNRKATVEWIQSIGADVVILATGAYQRHISLPGVDYAKVVKSWDILLGQTELPSPVVIVGGGAVGLETAEVLTRTGAEITVIEMMDQVGMDIYPGILALILHRLKEANVQILTQTKAFRLGSNAIEVETPKGSLSIPAAVVVEATGVLPNDGLKKQLDAKGIHSYPIGDCKLPRKAYDAVHEGFLTALSI